ncbi:hypothetical protein BRC91_01690 [Halobacteriales archaeon QS_4_62_28]|nr:MAG: hypothetical protein BRC91_01690 [Halobacteriales archaeon QS_4_62_28]
MSKMSDVDHTHPHTDEPFGAAFRRGPAVAADGGKRDDGSQAENDEQTNDETMEDVDHESPSEGADRAFERGTEGRTDSV